MLYEVITIFRKLLPSYQVSTKDELYSKIGLGIIQLDSLKKILKKNTKNKWIRYWSLQLDSFTRRGESEPPLPDITEDGTILLRENVHEHDTNYQRNNFV